MNPETKRLHHFSKTCWCNGECSKPETKPTHTPTQIGHSPLPWRMMPFGEKNLPFIAAGKSGYAVADTVMVSVNEDEARANAAFIVRAVNAYESMLEAMKSAVLALEGGLDDLGKTQNCSGHESTMDCVIDDLQQAIAKAEGKE